MCSFMLILCSYLLDMILSYCHQNTQFIALELVCIRLLTFTFPYFIGHLNNFT